MSEGIWPEGKFIGILSLVTCNVHSHVFTYICLQRKSSIQCFNGTLKVSSTLRILRSTDSDRLIITYPLSK